jgi:chromosome segregation ATPase
MNTEAIAKLLRKAAGEEDAKDRQGIVETAIKDIERGFNDLKDDIETANNESKGRKLKLRELEKEKEDFEDTLKAKDEEIKTAKEDNSGEDLKKEVEGLRTFKVESLKKQRDGFVKSFNSYKDHGDYEKVKSKLKLPEEKDGKLDFKDTSDEDMEHNQAEINRALGYGLFGDVKAPGTGKASSKIHQDTKVSGPFKDSDFKS